MNRTKQAYRLSQHTNDRGQMVTEYAVVDERDTHPAKSGRYLVVDGCDMAPRLEVRTLSGARHTAEGQLVVGRVVQEGTWTKH